MNELSDLLCEARELAVHSVLVSVYHDRFVVAVWTAPHIDSPSHQVESGRTADSAARKLLGRLRRKRRLARIEELGQ